MKKFLNAMFNGKHVTPSIEVEEMSKTINAMKSGFTLIELMVVVVIIGILAALAIPKFLGATDKAKISEARTMLKSISTQAEVYRVEKGSFPTSINVLDWYAENDSSATTEYFEYTGSNASGVLTITATEAVDVDGDGATTSTMTLTCTPSGKPAWGGVLYAK